MIFKMICSVVENQLFSRLSDIIGVESGLSLAREARLALSGSADVPVQWLAMAVKTATVVQQKATDGDNINYNFS